MAAAPGRATEVTLAGTDLRNITSAWTSFPAEVKPSAGDDATAARLIMKLPADAPVGIGALRVATKDGVSSVRLFMVDDLRTLAESGKNNSPADALPLACPVAVEGTCGATTSDYYRVTGRAGQKLAVEVVARRLGSPLDPLVRLLDAGGRELVWCDDSAGAAPDCRFEHTFAADGEYLIEVRDTAYQGGPDFRYRLRASCAQLSEVKYLSPGGGPETPNVVTESEPNDSPEAATPVELPASIAGRFDKQKDRDLYTFAARKGDRVLFRVRARSLGSPCDVALRLTKADGTRLADSKTADAKTPDPDEGTLAYAFPEDGTYHLLVRELNGLGGPGLNYRIDAAGDPGCGLALEVDKVDASASGEFELKVTCTRRDYQGPVKLGLEGVEGAELGDDVIKEGQKETRLKAKLPKGDRREQILNLKVVGRAKLGDVEYSTPASTVAALKKLFPAMLYPPAEFDGLVGLGVRGSRKAAASSQPSSKEK